MISLLTTFRRHCAILCVRHLLAIISRLRALKPEDLSDKRGVPVSIVCTTSSNLCAFLLFTSVCAILIYYSSSVRTQNLSFPCVSLLYYIVQAAYIYRQNPLHCHCTELGTGFKAPHKLLGCDNGANVFCFSRRCYCPSHP